MNIKLETIRPDWLDVIAKSLLQKRQNQKIKNTPQTKMRKYKTDSRPASKYIDGGMYRLQNSYVYYKLESKAASNFYVTSKKLGRFEKNN